MSESLLPCPFCNGKPLLQIKGSFYAIKCEDCHVKTDLYLGDESFAYKAWNKRVETK